MVNPSRWKAVLVLCNSCHNSSYDAGQVSNLFLKGIIFSGWSQTHAWTKPARPKKTRHLLGKQGFSKALLLINTETVFFLSSWLSACFSVSLDCSSTSRLFEPDSWAFLCLGFFLLFLPLCETPTNCFQRKASVTFSAELLKSKVTALLCLWNSFFFGLPGTFISQDMGLATSQLFVRLPFLLL